MNCIPYAVWLFTKKFSDKKLIYSVIIRYEFSYGLNVYHNHICQ